MAITITRPTFMAHQLTWGVHDDTVGDLRFSVSSTTFKYAFGLRPRAAADNALASDLAHRNWALLALIAREAQADGGITHTYNHNGWQVTHTIDDEVFRKLLERHKSQMLMPGKR